MLLFSVDGVWMGWALQEVPCGLPLHVVACKPGAGLPLQVPTPHPLLIQLFL